MKLHSVLLVALTVALTACHGRRHRSAVIVAPPQPNLVSIEVEVYDPVTNFVWENVGVRIVESYQEWTGISRPSQFIDDFFLTDRSGVVVFTEYDLADADVGFAEDSLGRAVLESRADRDQAIVTLEVWAEGFTSVFVDVDLSWAGPDVFIAVPFE